METQDNTANTCGALLLKCVCFGHCQCAAQQVLGDYCSKCFWRDHNCHLVLYWHAPVCVLHQCSETCQVQPCELKEGNKDTKSNPKLHFWELFTPQNEDIHLSNRDTVHRNKECPYFTGIFHCKFLSHLFSQQLYAASFWSLYLHLSAASYFLLQFLQNTEQFQEFSLASLIQKRISANTTQNISRCLIHTEVVYGYRF